jgi:hypothetical protein
MIDLMQRLKTARNAGVPLVLITTPDPATLVERIRGAFNGNAPPIVQWDCVRAMLGVNRQGADLINMIVPPPEPGGFAPPPGATLTDAIDLILTRAPDKTILIVHNIQRFTDQSETVQAISNARDPFKSSGKMLILLAPAAKLPIEISNDVMALDDPLPTGPEIEATIDRETEAAGDVYTLEPLAPETRRASIDALIGLPAFTVEQSLAMCLTENHAVRSADLWERKRGALTQGLTMDDGTRSLATMGGLTQIKGFCHLMMKGENPPALFIRIDEIEKAMAGAGGDLSGVSTDQLGVLLSALEDNGWSGAILVGVPGSGKSELSKSLGASYGRRTLTLDLGAAKGSLVGQSEAQIRQMVKTIASMAGNKAFFLASCNKLETLPPELRRRFRAGIWFFDLPSAEEREAIWQVQLTAFGLPLDSPRPADEGWTGAEIRNACEWAKRLRVSPADAAPYIVPIAQSDPDSVDRLRRAAAGKWLSASYPGAYRMPTASTQTAAPARRYVGGPDGTT